MGRAGKRFKSCPASTPSAHARPPASASTHSAAGRHRSASVGAARQRARPVHEPHAKAGCVGGSARTRPLCCCVAPARSAPQRRAHLWRARHVGLDPRRALLAQQLHHAVADCTGRGRGSTHINGAQHGAAVVGLWRGSRAHVCVRRSASLWQLRALAAQARHPKAPRARTLLLGHAPVQVREVDVGVPAASTAQAHRGGYTSPVTTLTARRREKAGRSATSLAA